MSLNQISSKDLAGADTTVVGSLRSGVAALGPSKRPSIGIEKRVFLLKTEPGLVLLSKVHRLVGSVSVVGLVGSSIRVESLTTVRDGASDVVSDGYD